jgi:hypothetical protein
MPPQDRSWRHEKDRPLRARKHPAQHRENRTIGGSEFRSLHLAAQHAELVAQGGDLDVFGVLAAEASEHHADESARRKVEEGESHRPIVAALGTCCSAHTAEFLNPRAVWFLTNAAVSQRI